jgi:hypothetical protein
MSPESVGEFAKFGLGMSTAAGITPQQAFAVAMTMQKAGIGGDESGVFMRQMAARLMAPTRAGFDRRGGQDCRRVHGATPDILVPALSALRRCKDSIDILTLVDSLPEIILPHLTWAASRRTDVQPRFVKILMKCSGEAFLERVLGRERLRQLKLRFAGWEDPSGLRGL